MFLIEGLELIYFAREIWSMNFSYTVKMNMLYLINKIVATNYKQYYLLN